MDVNKQLAETSELIEMSNDLLSRLGIIKAFENKEEVIFDKEIKKFGTGSAHPILPEKFIKCTASLIIKKRREDSKD